MTIKEKKEKEIPVYSKHMVDENDYDGGGNWGRFDNK